MRRDRLPFFALLAGNAVSLAGNTMTALAVPWFVLTTTGSAAMTGVSGFFALLPSAIAAFLGGGVADRFGATRTSVVADLLSGISVASIPILYATVGLPFPVLLALVFAGAFFDAPGVTARQALLPEAARAAGMGLERANSLFLSAQRSATLVGPPLAGVLIAALGASNVLLIDAATFAVSAALVGLAVRRPRPPAAARPSYLDQLREGLRFVRRDRLFVSIAVTIAITNLLDAPIFAVILPVYAAERFGSAAALGIAVAGFGAGSVIGTLAFGAVAHRLPRRATFVGAFLCVALSVAALATTPGLVATTATLAALGVAAGPLNPILMTLFHERIPKEIFGQAFGIVVAMALSAAPLGILAAGFVVERAGVGATLTVIAGCYLATTASMLVNPAFRDMAPRPPSASSDPPAPTCDRS